MSVVRISLGEFSAAIDSKGAQLTSLVRNDIEYLWQADAKWWPRSAPILFPIVGNLRDGFAISAEGECHMGRHGIARNYEHEAIENTGSSVTPDLLGNEHGQGRHALLPGWTPGVQRSRGRR